jgi:hypothetical protein
MARLKRRVSRKESCTKSVTSEGEEAPLVRGSSATVERRVHPPTYVSQELLSSRSICLNTFGRVLRLEEERRLVRFDLTIEDDILD